MFKEITKVFAIILAAFGMSSADGNGAPNSKETLMVKPGDIFVQEDKTGWYAIKILAVDPWPEDSPSAHCLTYQSVSSKPTIQSLQQTPVLIWHAPIDAASFSQGWELIGNQVPVKEEFVGFVTYLKLTDFARYIAFTGQDSKEIVRKANEHYKRAHALGDEGRRTEAIDEYSEAIELFPLFYEAIDNRAFTYMELGKIEEALRDFDQSLQVNPNGMAAFFSKGECLMKLGDLKSAEAIFSEGMSRFPAQRPMFAKFLKLVRDMQKNG